MFPKHQSIKRCSHLTFKFVPVIIQVIESFASDVRCSWALGTAADYLLHEPAPIGCGIFTYNFLTGAATVFSGRIRATRLIALSTILPAIGVLLLSILGTRIFCMYPTVTLHYACTTVPSVVVPV